MYVALFSRFEVDVVTLVIKMNESVIILLDLSHPTHDLLIYIYTPMLSIDPTVHKSV
jgi:hypothetical protein